MRTPSPQSPPPARSGPTTSAAAPGPLDDPFDGRLTTRDDDGAPPGGAALAPATMPLPLVGPATDPPRHDGHGGPLAVERSFAFVDVCGFTAYCDRHGEQAAIEVLTAFRAATRDVVGRRGVRVAKWLGDGVMLVGTAPSPVVAVVVELVGRARAMGLDTHAGVAAGPVLMFEGDDYVGRTVNLAARLCDAAAPGEVLGAVDDDDRPDWVHSTGPVRLSVPGMGRVGGIHRLAAAPEVEHALRTGVPAA